MLPRMLLLVALTAVAYVPACQGDFIWDDDRYVSQNPTLTQPGGLRAIWLRPGATDQYYPLVFTTFWIEQRIWGLNPAGYHWVNVFLHALNACLLWRLLATLRVPWPWFVAAVFALHPVHVESVAWITERKNVLSGFFYLISFLAYLRFSPLERKEAEAGAAPAGAAAAWYAASLVAFLAALLSKTVTCSLPAVIVLITWWKRGWPTRREWAALVPMFVLGAALALHTAQMEKQHVGASGPDWAFTPVERCLIAGRALWFYAGTLLWPQPLVFIYPRWQIDAADLTQYLYPLGWLVLLVALAAAAGRLGRGPLVAVLVFSGTLLPALGFFNVYPMLFSFVADHFQYLASIPLICLAVAAADAAGRRWLPGFDRAGVAAGAVVLAVLGGLTWQQGHVYANPDTLWRDTIAKNPGAWMAHYNLGRLLLDAGRDDEALQCFVKTGDLNPRHAYAFNNCGHILRRRAEAAEDAARQAAAAGDEAAARSRRDEATRLYDAAIAATEQAIACEPVVDPRIIHNLAEIHMDRGDVARAIVAYERALVVIRKQDPRRGFGSLVPQYVHELEAARQKERDALLPR